MRTHDDPSLRLDGNDLVFTVDAFSGPFRGLRPLIARGFIPGGRCGRLKTFFCGYSS
jgi:hypothetical protein